MAKQTITPTTMKILGVIADEAGVPELCRAIGDLLYGRVVGEKKAQQFREDMKRIAAELATYSCGRDHLLFAPAQATSPEGGAR